MSNSLNSALILKELPWLGAHFAAEKPRDIGIERLDLEIAQKGITPWSTADLIFGLVQKGIFGYINLEKFLLFSRQGVLLGAVGHAGLPRERKFIERILSLQQGEFRENVGDAIRRIESAGTDVGYVAHFLRFVVDGDCVERDTSELTVYKTPKKRSASVHLAQLEQIQRMTLMAETNHDDDTIIALT